MLLRDLLEELNVPTAPSGHHHVTKNRIQIECPHCSPASGKWRMGLHQFYFTASCWVCGRVGFLDTLSKASGVPLHELLAFTGGSLTPGRDFIGEGPKRGRYDPPHGLGPLLSPHKRFLAGRGFDPEEIRELWDVRATGQSDEYPWRLFLPAYWNDEPASWTTRSVGEREDFRYLSAPPERESYPIKEMLYGLQNAGHAVAVNEGPLDAWAIGPGGTATCGVGYMEAQLFVIGRFPLRVVCFDNEPDAQIRADALCKALSMFHGETRRVIFSGKDASRSPKSEIQQVRRMLK